ncbi:MAG: single-stranded DNA-binding protein, partial [Patescibacteria group bacterium]|nr:single-stranded DNA-binding protein [Patescibacteria group bacterium]
QQALVEGRLQTRSWDGPDGQKRYRTEIIASNIQFGFKSNSSGNAAASEASAGAQPEAGNSGEKIDYPTEEINPDDIPF